MQQGNIADLMKRARFDEEAATILFDHGGPEPVIGFHCQQAVEKILKSVLVSRGVNPPKSHDIVLLKQLLMDIGIGVPHDLTDIDLLDPYAVAERYSNTGITGTIAMSDALRMVTKVRAWARSLGVA